MRGVTPDLTHRVASPTAAFSAFPEIMSSPWLNRLHGGRYERRRDLRDNGVTVAAQSSHSGGNPVSQRE